MMKPEELRELLWKPFRDNPNLWTTDEYGVTNRRSRVFIHNGEMLLLNNRSSYDSVIYTNIPSKLFIFKSKNTLA